ncbi:DUF4393 domain-containing protein [bacterium SCSIO 12827]|nr:DUF4393 domain-containing protein [bacterium SCSIO 12827]
MSKEIIESAKAIQEASKAASEVANATTRAIKAAQDAGGFLANVFGTVPEDAVGLLGGDWLKIKRKERIAIMVEGTIKRLNERGVDQTSLRQISMAFGVPLLQHASLEEDELLSAMWANLLANAVDPSSNIEPNKNYVNLLNQLSPAEAVLLNLLGTLERPDIDISTRNTLFEEQSNNFWEPLSEESKILSIQNLFRLRLAGAWPEIADEYHVFSDNRTGEDAWERRGTVRGAEIDIDPDEFSKMVRQLSNSLMVLTGYREPSIFEERTGSKNIRKYNLKKAPEFSLHITVLGENLLRACQATRPISSP